jgi:membrane-bound lytic murein transglycosylase B
VTVPGGAAGNPAALTTDQLLWAAYVSAAKGVPASCHLPVTLLAAIGEVESSSLRGRSLDARHDVVPPVVGVALNGNGFAAIRDTDGGRLDGDPVWDRAVGPMQFIPSTWRAWGADGNGDGVADPQNIEDATLTAARYLCANGRDLSRASDLASAVLSYNGSQRYLATVIGLMDAVTSGASAAP